MKKKVNALEKYFSTEISVEFKACLYFFCILFFYCMYRLYCGDVTASIIHMGEMILLTYGMGYFQIYALSNFDEGENLRLKEFFYIFLCSGIYTLVSYLGNWFNGNLYVISGYFIYMVIAYICTFFVYKTKRKIDARLLNEDLKAFQERQINNE